MKKIISRLLFCAGLSHIELILRKISQKWLEIWDDLKVLLDEISLIYGDFKTDFCGMLVNFLENI